MDIFDFTGRKWNVVWFDGKSNHTETFYKLREAKKRKKGLLIVNQKPRVFRTTFVNGYEYETKEVLK